MPIESLLTYLNNNHVPYTTIRHLPAYTAQEIAELSHIPGYEIAKTIIVKLDDTLAMAVLSACEIIDFDHLAEVTGSTVAELATEDEFMHLFEGCEVGAMPPFGNLYGMKVFVDAELALDDTIAFNAGTHTELIKLQYHDFEDLVQPIMIEFGVMA
tara:strand:+ start:720 stop:1187 length:468 start_codon:yes stop_codon:yes gene_type:complete